MFWGFSEPLNFHEEYEKVFQRNPDELNILLFGSGDPRSILKTISKSYKYDTKINFYVIDGVIEIVARNMMLLSLALEDPSELSLKYKVHTFMDVYGNSLLRPTSHYYVASKANTLRRIITDGDYLEKMAPIFNIDNLKYRERDGIEESFNFYLPRKDHVYDIKKYWDNRIRQQLKERYDYRDGAFDWDLHMRLKTVGANQICPQEYRHFRNTGIAFTFPEYEQSYPNKTFAVGLVRNGTSYFHRGYAGDIEIGPFCTFGLKCPEERFQRSHFGSNEYRATDVTERNLVELFYELQERQEFTNNEGNTNTEHKYGSVVLKQTENFDASPTMDIELKKYEKPFMSFPNIKINFLSPEEALNLQNENSPSFGKYQRFFDIIFVSNKYFQLLKVTFKRIFKEEFVILFETQNNSILRKEDILKFEKDIQNYAKEIDFRSVTKFNVNIDHPIIRFSSNTCKNN